MGLFDIFKKKTVPPQHESQDDFNPLDVNSVISYIKKENPNATVKDVANVFSKLTEPEEDQDHLTPEGDLPWGWITANADFTGRIGTEYSYFFNAWYESRDKTPREAYAALKSFVLYMNDAKKRCHDMGECFEHWLEGCFTDDYLSARTKELNYIEENLPELEATYEQKIWFERDVLPTLEKELLAVIKNSPGILQKDIYKLFPPIAKSHIQEKLYSAEKAQKIVREKSGNTYKLFIE